MLAPAVGVWRPAAAGGRSGADCWKWKHCWPPLLQTGVWQVQSHQGTQVMPATTEVMRRLRKMERRTASLRQVKAPYQAVVVTRMPGSCRGPLLYWGGRAGICSECHTGKSQTHWRCGRGHHGVSIHWHGKGDARSSQHYPTRNHLQHGGSGSVCQRGTHQMRGMCGREHCDVCAELAFAPLSHAQRDSGFHTCRNQQRGRSGTAPSCTWDDVRARGDREGREQTGIALHIYTCHFPHNGCTAPSCSGWSRATGSEEETETQPKAAKLQPRTDHH